MKVCMIGSTGHVGYVLKGIEEDSSTTIVGVAPGSKDEKVETLIQKVFALGHKVRKYDNYCKMLDELKPDIAVVACHFGDHAKVALEAINRGIHVLCEKPVATTLEDLTRLKAGYARQDIHLSAMFGLRYTPWFLTAHQAIEKGAIGKVRLIYAQKSYKLGSRADFYKKRESYGGTIPWVGSHAIDWLYWFSGQRFESVFASHSTQNNYEHGELEMSALCHFTMTNEVFASVSIDYFRPSKALSHGDDRIRVVGTEGMIEVRDDKVYLINDEKEGIQELLLLPEQNIFEDFLKQVRGNGQCMVSAEDAFYVTEACLKARMSADEKRVISFTEGVC